MIEELMPKWNQVQDCIFILFLFCFISTVYIIAVRGKLIPSMLNKLFRGNKRNNLFNDTVSNEFISKIILSFQTTILFSVLVYCGVLYSTDLKTEIIDHSFPILAGIALIFIAYVICKFLLNFLVGFVFFDRENVIIWNDNFLSLISLSGLVIFVPVLLMFYVDTIFIYCLFFCLIYFLFVLFLTIYKIYEIFFRGKRLSLYFILYLCSLEMVPLFLAYKASIYLLTSM